MPHHTTPGDLAQVPAPLTGTIHIELQTTMTDYRDLHSTLRLMLELLIAECEFIPFIERVKITFGWVKIEGWSIWFKSPTFEPDEEVGFLYDAIKASFSEEQWERMTDPESDDLYAL